MYDVSQLHVFKKARRCKFFSVSDQRPDLAIQELQNFFVEKSSYPRPADIVSDIVSQLCFYNIFIPYRSLHKKSIFDEHLR